MQQTQSFLNISKQMFIIMFFKMAADLADSMLQLSTFKTNLN